MIWLQGDKELSFSVPSLGDLLRLTLNNPKAAAAQVLALPVSVQARWQGLALLVIVSVIMEQIASALLPVVAGDPVTLMLGGPLQSGAIQAVMMVVVIAAIHLVGRAFGGTGSFSGALILMDWLLAVMLMLQILQVVAILTVPLMGLLIFAAGLILFFWLLTHFTMVLHGFRSAGKVFATILLTLVAMAFASSVIAVMTGVGMPVGV